MIDLARPMTEMAFQTEGSSTELKRRGLSIVSHETHPDCREIALRKSRPGPEEELVAEFISRLEVRVPKGCRATLFKEPRLESGFPDMVVVVWKQGTTSHWHPDRVHLTALDLRILHLLVTGDPWGWPELDALFGKAGRLAVDRLLRADVVRSNSRRVWARPLHKVFAVRHIYAIEAKVSQVPAALRQASVNTWFAQSSYVLVPRMPKGSVLLDRAEDLGVGIWSANDTVLDARRTTPLDGKPVSHASWLFNEWVVRAEASPCGPSEVHPCFR